MRTSERVDGSDGYFRAKTLFQLRQDFAFVGADDADTWIGSAKPAEIFL